MINGVGVIVELLLIFFVTGCVGFAFGCILGYFFGRD